MQLYINNGNKSHTILFIHGYGKNHEDWNCINIENNLGKLYNIILVDIYDYLLPIDNICEKIYQQIKDKLISKIIIVSHSYGSFYAMNLCILYPIIFIKMLLIEPCIKSDDYKNYLESMEQTDEIKYRLKTFETLPNHLDIHNKITVRICINVDNKSNDQITMTKIKSLGKICNKNLKSHLLIVYNSSHMIHYKRPEIIIDYIKDIINSP